MSKRIALLAVYFLLTPVVLLSLILYTLYISHHADETSRKTLGIQTKNAQFQALPEENLASTDTAIYSVDVRYQLLENFLKKYKSPLADHTDVFIAVADKYNLDYRLLPAIAMQESNLCKKIPKRSEYNCWGFGIYGKKRTGFDSYPHAIETVAKTLSSQYIQKGLVEPEEIMSKYTPNSNGSWAKSVIFFMNKIQAQI